MKREGADFSLEEVKREAGGFITLKLPDLQSIRQESWETFVYTNYFQVLLPMSQVMTARSKGRVDWLLTAIEVLKVAAAGSPDSRAEALNRLGSLYALFVPQFPQYRALAIRAWEDYLALNSEPNDEVKKVQVALRQLQAGTSAGP